MLRSVLAYPRLHVLAPTASDSADRKFLVSFGETETEIYPSHDDGQQLVSPPELSRFRLYGRQKRHHSDKLCFAHPWQCFQTLMDRYDLH